MFSQWYEIKEKGTIQSKLSPLESCAQLMCSFECFVIAVLFRMFDQSTIVCYKFVVAYSRGHIISKVTLNCKALGTQLASDAKLSRVSLVMTT